MSPPERAPGAVARGYHTATKHSYQSVRSSGHYLDWETKPFPYKIYPALEPLRLPQELPWPTHETLRVLGGEGREPAPLTLEPLASLLFFSAGVTKKKDYGRGEEMHFRAAASTGALYETEVYVVAGELPGLGAGVYHFCPGDFALRRLRSGDFRQALAHAAADDELARHARPDRHLLAKHLEVPGAGLPALLLGFGDDAGQ